MVLDTLARRHGYAGLHPAFAGMLDLLVDPGLAAMAPGRHAIDGDRLYLSIDHREGRGRDGARLEAHRRYIDIQVTLEGAEEIGWRPLASCTAPAGLFDETRDIGFFDDRPETWLALPPGHFAIFFPDDAHAPLGGRGLLRKAVAKIAVSR